MNSEQVRQELRKELYQLRMKLQLLKMERIENDPRVEEVENKIKDVRRKFAQTIVAEREEKSNGKSN